MLYLVPISQVMASIRDCFVTGKWDASEDARTLLEQDDELYGDFEDLETGEKFEGKEEEDKEERSGKEEEEEEQSKGENI